MACSLPGFSVHGIFQARILEWVTISFSRRSSWPRDWTWVSHIVGRCFTIWATREVWDITDKGSSSQSYGFSNSHVWIWDLDHKEGWTLKNWFFCVVLLEKTLESPFDCEENKPVNPKQNLSLIFIGRTDAEAETPILCGVGIPNSVISQPWEFHRNSTWKNSIY